MCLVPSHFQPLSTAQHPALHETIAFSLTSQPAKMSFQVGVLGKSQSIVKILILFSKPELFSVVLTAWKPGTPLAKSSIWQIPDQN